MVRTSRFASATFSSMIDEDSNETSRVKLMLKGLSGVGFDAVGSDIHVGLMPDLGKRARYQAIVVAAPTSSVPPRLVGILDGAPEASSSFMSCGRRLRW